MINWPRIFGAGFCGLFAVAIALVLWLIVRPRLRATWYGPRIDPNSKCPACGNNQGVLKTTIVHTDKQKKAELFVQHTCGICSAFWFEPPVLKAEKWFAPPE